MFPLIKNALYRGEKNNEEMYEHLFIFRYQTPSIHDVFKFIEDKKTDLNLRLGLGIENMEQRDLDFLSIPSGIFSEDMRSELEQYLTNEFDIQKIRNWNFGAYYFYLNYLENLLIDGADIDFIEDFLTSEDNSRILGRYCSLDTMIFNDGKIPSSSELNKLYRFEKDSIFLDGNSAFYEPMFKRISEIRNHVSFQLLPDLTESYTKNFIFNAFIPNLLLDTRLESMGDKVLTPIEHKYLQ